MREGLHMPLRSAWHEAGHAAASHLLGGVPEHAWVDGVPGRQGSGAVRHDITHIEGDADLLVCWVAGYVCEELGKAKSDVEFFGPAPRPFTEGRAGGTDATKVSALSREIAGRKGKDPARVVRRAEKDACHLLRANWTAVAELAGILTARGRLTAAEIQTVMARS